MSRKEKCGVFRFDIEIGGKLVYNVLLDSCAKRQILSDLSFIIVGITKLSDMTLFFYGLGI